MKQEERRYSDDVASYAHVYADDAGLRLDIFLHGTFPFLSRTRIQSLIRSGAVQRSDKVGILLTPNYRISAGEHFEVSFPDPSPALPQAQDMALDILYEDSDIIVVNKPAGLVVHPGAGHWDGTLVNGLLFHCKESLSGISGVCRPGIVHRLDKDTSGILVAAKNDVSHHHLSAQFAAHGRDGRLHRGYYALVWKHPDPPCDTVDAPLSRHAGDFRKIQVDLLSGREAITHYETVSRFSGFSSRSGDVALLRCRLETGRTHQIRVHMRHIGHPLLGDRIYGSHFMTCAAHLSPSSRFHLERLNRHALHAYELGFEHPRSGDSMVFRADLPYDMDVLLRSFGHEGHEL